MFDKILLPTDGSRHSQEAANLAGRLAAGMGGVVRPIVAVEFVHLRGGGLSEEVVAAVSSEISSRAREVLGRANEAIVAAGGRTDGGQIVEGQPAAAILAAAGEWEADVIVIGSQGLGLEATDRRLVGSVTARVLHDAMCPVLVMPAERLP